MTGKRPSTLQIIEVGSDRYANLEMAQALALDDVVQVITDAVRERLTKEKLIVVNGQVVLTEDNKDE